MALPLVASAKEKQIMITMMPLFKANDTTKFLYGLLEVSWFANPGSKRPTQTATVHG